MGIIDDFKRLFWVKRAVAESAAEKAAEKGREFGEDIADKASQTWQKGKAAAEEIGEKIVSKTKEGYEEVKEKAGGLWDKKDDWVPTSREETKKEDPSSAYTAGEKTRETLDKVGDKAEKTWEKAKEEGKELLDKAVKTSDKVWEKAEEVSEDLWDKAKQAANKAGEKWNEGVDSMLEKAKALDKKIEEEKDKVDRNRDGWADTSVQDKLREHESTLKGKDDFFEKADRYAQGDYSMGKPVVIKKGDDAVDEGMTELPPLPEDDIAEDAILDDGDEPKDKS